MEKVKIYTDARFKAKSDTLKNWQSKNPILLSGEPSIVVGLNEAGDGLVNETERIKFGDGVTTWNDLPWWKGPQGPRGLQGDGIGRVTAEGGEIFNDYENNKALAICTHSQGSKTVAGTYAFEIKDIAFEELPDNEEEETTGQVASYYVKANESEEQDGSQEYPFNTIAQAIASGITVGLIEGDTLIVNLLGDITWVDGASHPFKVIVQSADDTQKRIESPTGSILLFQGNMEFKNIYIKGKNSSVNFCGNDITLDENSVLDVWYITYGYNENTRVCPEQTVTFNGNAKPFSLNLSNGYGNITYTGDVTTIADNGSRCIFYFGNTYGSAIYEKNINFDFKDVSEINFSRLSSEKSEYTLNGAIQIINSSMVSLNSEAEGLDIIDSSKLWILTNKSILKDVLSFTSETGKFAVKEGYIAIAYNIYGDEITSADGVLDLSADAGEYTVDIQESATYEGKITLSSVTGLQNGMLISVKSVANQDFLLNAGTITTVDTESDSITVIGHPSQMNRFLSAGKKYLFILADCMLGDFVLGDCSSANGINTKTIGKGAHTDGEGTIATADNQYVCGKYNANKPNTIFELGCGTSDVDRRNAFEVYKDGTISIYGTKITRDRLRKLLALLN